MRTQMFFSPERCPVSSNACETCEMMTDQVLNRGSVCSLHLEKLKRKVSGFECRKAEIKHGSNFSDESMDRKDMDVKHEH